MTADTQRGIAGEVREHDQARDYRNVFDRDVDRILYSPEFRRLGGVTQVVPAGGAFLVHNRLTHSLKVAQLSRRTTQKLVNRGKLPPAREGGPHSSAAAAAALAHDLGHPPFGHVAESELRRCCDEVFGLNGFEGNPQSFRIVTKLAIRRQDVPGMDLTQRTLAGILKYPWLRSDGHEGAEKWGAYATESASFGFATNYEDHVDRGEDHIAPSQSIEAQIMDWCDDITYAVHDLEDFYRAGLTMLGLLQTNSWERERILTYTAESLRDHPRYDREAAQNALHRLIDYFPFEAPFRGNKVDTARIEKLASELIREFQDGIDVVGSGPEFTLLPTTESWHKVNILKRMTWYYVIHDPRLATLQEGQARVIRELFEYCVDWIKREDENDRAERLPNRLRTIWQLLREDPSTQTTLGDDEKIRARAVADYIACLTEIQAVTLHARVTGAAPDGALGEWLIG